MSPNLQARSPVRLFLSDCHMNEIMQSVKRMDVGIGLTRVETELAALASLAAAVPEVLTEGLRLRRRFSGI